MTLFYDEDRDAVIENHPDEFIHYDDEGRLIIEFGEMPDEHDGQKRADLLHAAISAFEAHGDYEVTSAIEWKWVGGDD